MLTHLSIQNFTLVDKLDLELNPGMTAVTGETGAGKSIMLDALALALGDRGDGDRVRVGQERADISAQFEVSNIAERWLIHHDLADDGDCILRRVITREGRSRGYINGQPATMSQLRELGNLLIDIHSQHEHQSLLRKETHRNLLDNFGGLQKLADKVQNSFNLWNACAQRLKNLLEQSAEHEQKLQLLSFQVEELEALALAEGELDELENEQKLLANAEQSLSICQHLAQLCGGEEQSLETLLANGLQQLQQLPHKSNSLKEAEELLTSADIQVGEASLGLNNHLGDVESNPERLKEVDDRLGTVFQTARKHRIQPSELVALHQQLQAELDELTGDDNQVEHLEAEEQSLKAEFMTAATEYRASEKKRRKNSPRPLTTNLKIWP